MSRDMSLEHIWITKEGDQWWVTSPHGYTIDGACVRVFLTWSSAVAYTANALNGGRVRRFRGGRKFHAAH